MNIGPLTTGTGTTVPERKVPTTLKKNQVMLQWRMRDAQPGEQKRWMNHSAIDKDTAKSRVQDFNDYSTQFDYRIRPERKVVDSVVSEAKVAA